MECTGKACVCVWLNVSFVYSCLPPSLLWCVEGHRHSCAVAHVSDTFDSQQLPAIHLSHDQEPAFILQLGEPGSLGLTVLLPLKEQTHCRVNGAAAPYSLH